jgi:E3 ubiquitin-protein ligase CCNP1IP1
LCKNLTEKYGHINSQLDKVVNEANAQLQNLQNKIQGWDSQAVHGLYMILTFKTGLTIDSRSLHEKNNELIEMYRDKSKKHAQTQHLYDTLKKRILMSQVETAASDNVAQTLKTMAGGARPGTFNGIGFAQAGGLDVNAVRERQSNTIPVNEHGIEQLHRHQRQGSGSNTSGDMAAMPPPDHIPSRHRVQSTTPLHRTQLPGARPAAPRSQIPMSTARPAFVGENRPPRSALRHSLGSSHVNRNSLGSATGFGFTAGMKVGRVPDAQMDGIDHHERSYTSGHH